MMIISYTVLIGRAILVTISIALSGIILLSLFSSADAAYNGTDYEQDSYEWNVLAGEDLLNDPLAAKILQNIEISKQRIAQLQDPQIHKTEHEKYVDQLRQIANKKLQEDLERMYKNNENSTARAAFAKYVAKKPAEYHDLYWELFEYMYHKVTLAREARDEILEKGGTYREAQQIFIQIASITKAESIWKVQQVNEKYGFTNKISDLDNFNALPTEYKNAYEEYTKLSFDQKKELYFFGRISENKVSEPQNILGQGGNFETNAFELGTFQEVSDTSTSVELVSFTSPFVLEESGDKFSNEEKNKVTKILSLTSMSFSGNGYTTKVIDSMDEVSQFTLSTWVKPDYSKGSTELTILSKENAFSLTITNNILPKHILRFSVFDGIKWTMLESSSSIDEKWTHVAVTLDGPSISLFIDGKLEATKQIQGIPSMNSYGFVSLHEVENISSEKTILIGAQESTKRGELKQKGFFSGQIDEVVIEDELFDEQKIQDLCQESQYYSA